jgi:hypothetical protein
LLGDLPAVVRRRTTERWRAAVTHSWSRRGVCLAEGAALARLVRRVDVDDRALDRRAIGMLADVLVRQNGVAVAPAPAGGRGARVFVRRTAARARAGCRVGWRARSEMVERFIE